MSQKDGQISLLGDGGKEQCKVANGVLYADVQLSTYIKVVFDIFAHLASLPIYTHLKYMTLKK